MAHPRLRHPLAAGAAALALASGPAVAQLEEVRTPRPPTAPTRLTVEAIGAYSHLDAGQPDGNAFNLRLVADLPWGDTLNAELLDERKFGTRGGVAAAAYTRQLNRDWYAIGTFALGHGGPNWANSRIDIQASRKWLERQQLVTSAAVYGARYDAGRSDQGARLSAAWYGERPAVAEAGVVFNVSQPGSVNSAMPYVSAVFGSEGTQFLTVRATAGREAYQALGTEGQLVDFPSRSLGLLWRRWLAPDWGLSAFAELYHNPTYDRRSVGLGVFSRW